MQINLNKFLDKSCIIFFIIYICSLYLFGENLEYIYISEIFFLAFVGVASISIIINKKIYIDIAFWLPLIFIIYSLTTAFWALDAFEVIIKSKTLIQIFIFYTLIYQFFTRKKNVDAIIKALLIAGIALGIYVIYIYGIPTIINALLDGKRLGREISQENILGIQGGITAIICFYYAIYKNRKEYYLISILPFMIVAISGSRKAILIVVIGIAILFFLKYGFKKIYKFILVFILGGVGFYYLINLPMFSMIYKRMEGLINTLNGTKVEASADERLSMISYGIEKFLDKPLLGYGTSNYCVLWQQKTGKRTYSHNNFIELLVNNGIIGFVLYYGIYIYLFYGIINRLKNNDNTGILIFTILSMRLFMDIASVSYYSKATFIYFALAFVYIKITKPVNKSIVIK